MKQIQSSQNGTFKEWKKLLRRKGREKAGLYIIEGPHLVTEAIKEESTVTAIIFDEAFEAEDALLNTNYPVFQLSRSLFSELSSTENSQGVIAVCKIKINDVNEEWKRFLLIDAVQDPGNLGTLIRTADAAGLDAVYLGTGTVDLYNDKALRSAQGSHFHIPVIQKPLIDVISEMKTKSIPVVGTSLTGELINESQSYFGNGFALIVGNEGNGVQSDLLEMTDTNLKIPIYGHAESLNVAVAAGILMYYLRSGKMK